MKYADVQEEYNKNKQLRKEDVQQLQEWIKKQPHLPSVSELEVILFLHSCYYSIEMTKTTIDKYFTYRGMWPDFFANQNPSSSHVDMAAFVHLPNKTPENYQIHAYKMLDRDVDRYNLSETLKHFDMSIVEWLMH